MPLFQTSDDGHAALRLASAVGAGFVRDPVGRAPGGGYDEVDHPVHVLLLWSGGILETVHAWALDRNADVVHVRVYARGAQSLPSLPARHVVRCSCSCSDDRRT